MVFWFCVSVALNGVLAIYAIRRKREAWAYRKEAASERLVTKVLADELSRKLGPRKALRIARATENTIRQALKPKESEV